MSATAWYVIEIIGFALAAVLLLLDVILFIKLKVPTLVAEISGKRFEKEVKLIRERNMAGDQRWMEGRRPQRKNMDVINVPDKRQEPPDKNQNAHRQETEDNSTSILSYDTTETMVLSNKTSILHDGGATTLLNPNEQFQVVRSIIMLHTDERIL